MFNITKPNSWLIIDDLAESIEEWSQDMLQLLLVRYLHEKFFITVVLHNLFHQSKCMRTLDLNCTYYILYRVVCDSSSIITLNKQIYSSELKFLLLAYNQATNKSYGYILLDLKQNTPEELRLVTNILDNEITVHLPVNNKNGH